MRRTRLLSLALVVAGGWALSTPALAQDTYQTPPASLAALVDAPVTPGVSLSPDRRTLLLLHRPTLESIAQLAEPELRLAGIRINPANTGPSRASTSDGLSLVPVDGGATAEVVGLGENPLIRNTTWSPDGGHVAFTLDGQDRIELRVLDIATGQVAAILDAALHDAAYGGPIQWIDEQTLLVRTVAASRGSAPEAPRAPAGPVIQENLGEEAPARTYQDLLEDQHDEDLFEHYMTSQLMRVTLDGEAQAVGAPAMYIGARPSPDGRYVLVQTLNRPFSYLVPARRFPTNIEVWDTDGAPVATVAELPLAEDVPTAFGSVRTGVRSVAWRADAPSTLYWAEALDGGDARVETEERDRVMTLAAPFDGPAEELTRLGLRYAGVQWTEDGPALVSESWWASRTRRMYSVDPETRAASLVFDVSYEDRYADPGSPLTRSSGHGTRVVYATDDGSGILMVGQGASPEGNRPFLRRMDLSTGRTDELFRSDAPYYEVPLSVLDGEARTILTRRESQTEPPNYFVRDLGSGQVTALTAFPHPYPELADIQKEAIQYTRDDGVTLSATLYLPPGYDAAADGPLPAFVWAYPREFKSAAAAGQRRDSPYQFTRVSYWGAVPYVTQGYAVIDNASMPVVGEGEAEPNDSFREQLVMNADAAIAEGVRRGVVDPDRVAIGGHSYGAFMTANLLAHSDLFRAGVARSGAYNRTLTPFGFQSEQRLFWEAPEIYFYMSPFMHAEKVNEPILMIHGMADNNSGTFPIQSERYYNALKGLGKTARLVMLPHESHGYRARESIMHMLWETNRWLDMYVKNATPSDGRVTDAEPPVSEGQDPG